MNYASFAYVERLNVLQELNSMYDVAGDADLRNTLFELQEDLDNDSSSEDLESGEEAEESELHKHINRGREMLQDTILCYHEAKIAFDDAKREYEIAQSRVRTIESTMALLENDAFKTLRDTFKEEADKVLKTHEGRVQAQNLECRKRRHKLQRMREVFRILKNSDATFACPVCLKNQANCFLMPCGHTFCNACMSKAANKCFICRQGFTKVGNLFFS
jgi:hypothetical protein